MPEGETAERTPLRPWTLLAIIAVAASALLATFWAWRPSVEPRLPTYQEVLDTGESLDGDDWPDTFPRYGVGDLVRVRDTIVSISYRFYPPWATLAFPYRDGKWTLLNDLGSAPAFVEGDVGAFAPGDTVELDGTVEAFTARSATYEFIRWRVRGGPGPLPPPIGSLSNLTLPGYAHAAEIANVSRLAATAHFDFPLLREGQGVDTMQLDELPRGIYMRFENRNDPNYLDPGDRVLLRSLPMGNYTLVLRYARTHEVARLSFWIP